MLRSVQVLGLQKPRRRRGWPPRARTFARAQTAADGRACSKGVPARHAEIVSGRERRGDAALSLRVPREQPVGSQRRQSRRCRRRACHWHAAAATAHPSPHVRPHTSALSAARRLPPRLTPPRPTSRPTTPYYALLPCPTTMPYHALPCTWRRRPPWCSTICAHSPSPPPTLAPLSPAAEPSTSPIRPGAYIRTYIHACIRTHIQSHLPRRSAWRAPRSPPPSTTP